MLRIAYYMLSCYTCSTIRPYRERQLCQSFFSVALAAFRVIDNHEFQETNVVFCIDRITEEADSLSAVISCHISAVRPFPCDFFQEIMEGLPRDRIG